MFAFSRILLALMTARATAVTMLDRAASEKDSKPRKDSRGAAGRTLLTLDKNNDGVVDPTEVAEFAKSQGLDAASVTQEFMDIDENGDGRLDSKELARALEAESESAQAPEPAVGREKQPRTSHRSRNAATAAPRQPLWTRAPHGGNKRSHRSARERRAEAESADDDEERRAEVVVDNDEEDTEEDKKLEARRLAVTEARRKLEEEEEEIKKKVAAPVALKAVRKRSLKKQNRVLKTKEDGTSKKYESGKKHKGSAKAAVVQERLAEWKSVQDVGSMLETNTGNAFDTEAAADYKAESSYDVGEETESAEGSMSALLAKEAAWETEAQLLEQRAQELRLNATLLAKSTSRQAAEAGVQAALLKSKLFLHSLNKLESGAKKAEVTAAALRAKADAESQEANDLMNAADAALK